MDTPKQDSPTEYEILHLLVSTTGAGTRLDTYLASQIEGWSRARLQQLIEDEEVLVNGRRAKSSQKLQANDKIEVELIVSPATAFAAENIRLDIVYEDSELVVVNKPAGLVVHPAAGVQSGTLANALAYHFEQLSVHAGAIRPGSCIGSIRARLDCWLWPKPKWHMRGSRISFEREKCLSLTWLSFMELSRKTAAASINRSHATHAIGRAWRWSAQDDLPCRSFVCGAGMTGSRFLRLA